MSLLSVEYLIKSLQSLQPTQDSMQTLSLYIKTNTSEYEKIVLVWAAEFEKSNIYHKLNLLYLTNEILLTIKPNDPKHGNLLQAFRNVVPLRFKEALNQSQKNTILSKKYYDLGKVWIQRGIFQMEDLFKNLEGIEISEVPQVNKKSKESSEIGKNTIKKEKRGVSKVILHEENTSETKKNGNLNCFESESSSQREVKDSKFKKNLTQNDDVKTQNNNQNRGVNRRGKSGDANSRNELKDKNSDLKRIENEKFKKENIFQRIEEYFETKQALISYLEEFIEALKNE
ncbi:hypothetical protein CWI38_0349p0030 [Hamiltosporidium tvaerminnensis]|uniref:CID domain-containing protein n=2 Tax=Hamiltosporidium TaxID=1176354 RepID=A0A4Q9KZF2_9MICR|nr:Regulation of nuclear pre-mRNA domain-containing protein 1A [Hamiltosporidium tvaerminnensis]TBT98812.1 hypothetical protein CWI37_1584p0020 [Hamiltosporidium tvaerminnensis]TBU00045.1 hypothetical protein CWI36_1762p0010 [Hamiltosporidium magnivora]TBU00979.1 hypothetical protein CWI39_1519p0020 [Hamiltosporidium magnivora]TBU13733.1 hypothetical protein CWI38_0349p0030 [Hamiltosporidium tvaerminnensis]